MSQRPRGCRQTTRRSLLQGSLFTSAVMALPDLLAAEEDEAHVHPAAKVETEKYPWGQLRWLMNATIDPKAEMTMGLVHMEPHQNNVLHVHPNSAEFLHVLSGTAEHLASGRWVTLKPGDTLRIPKGVPHQSRTGDQGFDALIVYDTPNRIMLPVTENPPARNP